jgi:hypothetical protein
MSCDRYTDAIIDHACGAEIASDAAAHLKNCAECGRVFDEQRRSLREIDQDLQSALAVDPSVGFVAGVMAAVESSTVRRRRTLWWSLPAAVAAGLVLAVLTSVQFAGRRPAEPHQQAALPQATPPPVENRGSSSPSPLNRAPSADAGSAPRIPVRRVMHDRTRTTAPQTGTIAADVVVPVAQSQALARYLSLVRRGAIDTSSLANPEEATIAAPGDLVIAPLSVEGLPATLDMERGIGPGVESRGLR